MADEEREPAPEWVDMVHPEIEGATQRVANRPDVVHVQESKGWVLADPDDEADRRPFVPAVQDAGDGVEWVTLVHPDLPAGTNTVPNNSEALAGAFQAGWALPDADPQDVAERLRELHPRGGRSTEAERAQAEADAQLAAAATDDPVGVPPAAENAGDAPADEGK